MKFIMSIISVIILVQCGYAKELKGLPKDILIVTGNNVNVRVEPNVNSNEVLKINLADKVKIIKRSGKIITIGDKNGEWLYVDTRKINKKNRETFKGWVFSYYLSDLKNFQIYKTTNICKMEGSVGDFFLYYEINKDGTYKRKFYDNNTNKLKYIEGQLYKYRDVVLAYDNDDTFEILFLQNGNLCSKYVNDKGQICAQCK